MININLLPKNLRRRREPGYWRLIAALFPLLALAIVVFAQMSANQTEANLRQDKDLHELQLAQLRPALQEQQQLQARQKALNSLIAVANSVHSGRVVWSAEFLNMLETLPPREGSGQPKIAFSNLTMRASQQKAGKGPVAELSVQGTALNTGTLATYIRALQDSSLFDVDFQSASRQGDTGLYQFSLSIDALATEGGSK